MLLARLAWAAFSLASAVGGLGAPDAGAWVLLEHEAWLLLLQKDWVLLAQNAWGLLASKAWVLRSQEAFSSCSTITGALVVPPALSGEVSNLGGQVSLLCSGAFTEAVLIPELSMAVVSNPEESGMAGALSALVLVTTSLEPIPVTGAQALLALSVFPSGDSRATYSASLGLPFVQIFLTRQRAVGTPSLRGLGLVATKSPASGWAPRLLRKESVHGAFLGAVWGA